jgi:hypothetical protein
MLVLALLFSACSIEGDPATSTTVTTSTVAAVTTSTTADFGAAVTSLSETITTDDSGVFTQSATCIAELLIEETGPEALDAWETWWTFTVPEPMITTQSSADASAAMFVVNT